MKMTLEGKKGRYRTGRIVARFPGYRLYICTAESGGRQCLLQIAKEPGDNSNLIRAAYVLGQLKLCSDTVEDEYAKVKEDEKDMLNYDLGFPHVLDSWRCKEQGGRQVNILAFKHVSNVSKLIALSSFRRDKLRIDLRSSVWIMGKLLKLLAFTHSEGFAVTNLSPSNVVIEPDQHYVVIFDWSDTTTHTEEMSSEARRNEISQAAQAVINAMGGDHTTVGSIPDDGGDAYSPYAERLFRLARSGDRDAQAAHTKFYDLVDKLWTRGFYEFTTHPIS